MIVLFIIHLTSIYHWFEAFLKENGDFEQKKVNFGGGGGATFPQANFFSRILRATFTRGQLSPGVNFPRATFPQ